MEERHMRDDDTSVGRMQLMRIIKNTCVFDLICQRNRTREEEGGLLGVEGVRKFENKKDVENVLRINKTVLREAIGAQWINQSICFKSEGSVKET